MAPKTEATLLDKLGLLLLAGRALASILYRFVAARFHDGPRASKPLKDALFAGLRKISRNITTAQEAFKNKEQTTINVYSTFCEKNKLKPETTELASGLKLCWIGRKDAKKVLLYFHGGGYVNGASSGHLQWAADLQKTCSEHQSFSVIFVAYTLVRPSSGSYPIQLKEAAEALHHVLETQGRKPSDVILGGDSAGGHLVVSLLGHLVHPHPEAIRIDLKEPLQSALLISPWVSFQVEDSYRRNAHSDFLTETALQRWIAMFRRNSEPDNYNEPIRADANWWKGLDTVVKDLLIWGGGAEVFIDSIEEFAKTVKAAHPEAKLVVEPGASHVNIVVDLVLGYGKGDSGPLFDKWVKERI